MNKSTKVTAPAVTRRLRETPRGGARPAISGGWGRPIRWRKSSRSQTSNCVETAWLDEDRTVIGLRDSKDSAGPILTFDRSRWLVFLAGARNGNFRQG